MRVLSLASSMLAQFRHRLRSAPGRVGPAGRVPLISFASCVRQGAAAGAERHGHHAVPHREHGTAERRNRDRRHRHRERHGDGTADNAQPPTTPGHRPRPRRQRRRRRRAPARRSTTARSSRFTTTMGRIEPAEARTNNGQVRVRLIAGSQSGNGDSHGVLRRSVGKTREPARRHRPPSSACS